MATSCSTAQVYSAMPTRSIPEAPKLQMPLYSRHTAVAPMVSTSQRGFHCIFPLSVSSLTSLLIFLSPLPFSPPLPLPSSPPPLPSPPPLIPLSSHPLLLSLRTLCLRIHCGDCQRRSKRRWDYSTMTVMYTRHPSHCHASQER